MYEIEIDNDKYHGRTFFVDGQINGCYIPETRLEPGENPETEITKIQFLNRKGKKIDLDLSKFNYGFLEDKFSEMLLNDDDNDIYFYNEEEMT